MAAPSTAPSPASEQSGSGAGTAHGPVPAASTTLPPRPPGFTGREAELDRLLPRLAPESDESAALLISAVTGMGGIGKTALAVEAAHRAGKDAWFPGGHLFVDLRGYDDNPVGADQAVQALLDAMGVRGADLPATAARQRDLYHRLFAERRERTLLILDNASDSAQYLPLLPRANRHRALITSRDRPSGLPVRVIDLETLDPAESATLVIRALHGADERDDRPVREPEALRELTELCGHLPLALQIAAAMLRHRRHRDIASLVTEIKEAGDAVTVLDDGSPGTDLYGRSLLVGPVLRTSYHRLPPDRARLLRLLCLTPGADTGTEAVAVLAGLDENTTLRLLDDLTAAYLVTPVREDEQPTSAMRWRLHDLVRAFGASVVAGDGVLREEGEAARERVLGFYGRWTDAADDRLRWLPGKAEPERFGDRREALAWLDRERAGLVAAVSWGREGRFADTAVRLGLCLAEYLSWRRHFDDWITVSRAAREAAHQAGDRDGEAMAWNNLGTALLQAGRVEEAIDAHTRARDLHQADRALDREAMAWDNLGLTLLEAERVEEAIDAHTRARDLFQAAGNHHAEAMAWNNLGLALRKAGRVEEAIYAHTRDRDMCHAAGDRHGEAMAWDNLGLALRRAGQVEEAIKSHSKALAIDREFEDWHGAGQTLHNLAAAHEAVHRPTEARPLYLQAADAFTRANAAAEAAHARAAAEALE